MAARTPSDPLAEAGRRNRRQRGLLLLALLALAALLAWMRLDNRADIEADERSRLEGQARAIEQNMAGQFVGIYAALLDLRLDLPTWAPPDRARRASQHLVELCNAMPGVESMVLMDASGRVEAASQPRLLGSEGAVRPYFAQARQSKNAGALIVSEPFKHALGEHSVDLAIILRGTSGEFAGLVAATLRAGYLQTLLTSALYAPDMWAAVVHGAGEVVVTSQAQQDVRGVNMARPGTLFSRYRETGASASVFTGSSVDRGDRRLVAMRAMRPDGLPMDQPLVVAVSRNFDALLAPWQQQTSVYAALFVVAAVLGWLALLAAQRRRAELEGLAAEQVRRREAEAERLALALRGADLALWDADLVNGQGSVNERWYSMLGYAPGEIGCEEKDWQALLHPEERDRVMAAQHAHIEGRAEGYEQTYRMRHRDGHWVWLLDRGRVVERDVAGRALRMVGTHMDISDRMQGEERLRRSEQSLATTLHSIGDAVLATDPQGRVTRINATAERMTGWSADQALGQPLSDLFRIIDADTRQPLPDPVARVVEHGDIVGLAEDTVLIARDGTEQPIAHTAAPIRAASGEVEGVVLVFSDVSERFAMLQALRDREAQLSTLTAALPGPVARLDGEGRHLFANLAWERWFGVPAAQLLGRPFCEVLGSEAAAVVEQARRRVRTGETVTFDLALPTRDGARDAMVTMVPDRSSEQGVECVRGCFIVATDITERKRAEEALRRSEQKTRALLGALRPGVVVHAPDTQVLDANPSACRILGLTLDQMRGKVAVDPAWHFIETDHTPMLPGRYPVAQVLASGEPLKNFLGGVVRPDLSHPVWVLCDAFPLHGPEGSLQEMVVTFADITERKLAEEELQRTESRLRMTGRVARLGGWRLELAGPKLLFSPELRTLLELDPELPFEAHVAYDFVVPEHRPRLRTRLTECVREGSDLDEEVEAYTASGRRLHLRVIGEALREGNGRTVALQGAVQDITERKQADAAMRVAQEDLAATLDAVPDLLFDVDSQGLIHGYHSPRGDLLLMAPQQFVGRLLDDVVPPEVAAVIRTALVQAWAEGHSSGLQYELDLPDGRRSFELSVAPKPVPADAPARYIVLARDVTDRKQAETERRGLERQLREAQKMESIGTLAGGIAHDFNNILAAILGNVALAHGDLPAGHAALGSLEQISKAGLRARALVQQILTFSRRQPSPLVVQPLRPIVDESLALLRATLPAAVRLDTVLPDEDLRVEADATQLQQVLMNLCTNGWHALPDGRGRIEVGFEALSAGVQDAAQPQLREMQPGPTVHLWVRDNGSGMDAATSQRIFDPFFTTKPVGQGTGLGLSVVHGIVRSHGGAIVVDTQVGHGSTFHVYLPQVSAHGASGVIGPRGADVAGFGMGQQVLYVDDDEVMVLMVQRLLRREGYIAAVCGSALEAQALVSAELERFDLVISDYNMPEASGLELAAHLRRLHPGLPMIISSGYITSELREQAAALGVRALLQKERTLEELPALVAEVLAAARTAHAQA